MTILYTSDLHYNHPYVAKLRGFTRQVYRDDEGITIGDTEAHDAMILDNWNRAVRKTDRVYVAGDFAMNWEGVSSKLAQMNGEIILVCGNHDIMSGVHRDGWKHRAR